MEHTTRESSRSTATGSGSAQRRRFGARSDVDAEGVRLRMSGEWCAPIFPSARGRRARDCAAPRRHGRHPGVADQHVLVGASRNLRRREARQYVRGRRQRAAPHARSTPQCPARHLRPGRSSHTLGCTSGVVALELPGPDLRPGRRQRLRVQRCRGHRLRGRRGGNSNKVNITVNAAGMTLAGLHPTCRSPPSAPRRPPRFRPRSGTPAGSSGRAPIRPATRS
mgnify:CR=1 FL=1